MPRAPPLPPLRLVQARNNVAELESLLVMGDGSFALGVRYVVNLWRERSLVQVRDQYEGPVGAGYPQRSWVEAIFEDDARALGSIGGGLGPALSVMMWCAANVVPADMNRRIFARLREIDHLAATHSDDAAFERWHAPPRARGGRQGLLDGYPPA